MFVYLGIVWHLHLLIWFDFVHDFKPILNTVQQKLFINVLAHNSLSQASMLRVVVKAARSARSSFPGPRSFRAFSYWDLTVTIMQWSAANMRIMLQLLSEGALLHGNVSLYLYFTLSTLASWQLSTPGSQSSSTTASTVKPKWNARYSGSHLSPTAPSACSQDKTTKQCHRAMPVLQPRSSMSLWPQVPLQYYSFARRKSVLCTRFIENPN